MKKKLLIIIILLISFSIFIIFNLNIQKDHNIEDEDWKYDENEYPKDEYTIDELPVSHKSAYEVRQFFEDSDSNHDGVLKNQEINTFDYKIKHSQFSYNGPYGYN